MKKKCLTAPSNKKKSWWFLNSHWWAEQAKGFMLFIQNINYYFFPIYWWAENASCCSYNIYSEYIFRILRKLAPWAIACSIYIYIYIYMLVLLYCTCTGRRVCHSRFPVKPLQAWSSCTSHTPPEDGSQTSGVDRWHSPAAGSVEDRCTHPSQAHTDEYHSYMLENKNKQYQSSINPSFHHVVGRGVTAHVLGLSVQYACVPNKSFHFFSGKSDNKWHFGATLLIIIFQQQIETV